jgi:two-component system sensor histidine kinase/response regulator
MSHEIRTPLNAIIGLTHLLRRSGASAEQLQRLAKIDGAAATCWPSSTTSWTWPRSRPGAWNWTAPTSTSRRCSTTCLSIVREAAHDKGLVIEVATAMRRCGCAATRCACARRCSTLPAMR